MSLMSYNVQFNTKMFTFTKQITDAEKDEFFMPVCYPVVDYYLFKKCQLICAYLKIPKQNKKQTHKIKSKTKTNTVSVDLHKVYKASWI